jgi:RNA polymerase sigma-70 factor (ECF subfamily)
VLDVVVLASARDDNVFEALALRNGPRLDRLARQFLRDPELAADAVQDALIQAWRDLPGLRDPAAIDRWLHQILVRTCIDASRHRRRALAVNDRATGTLSTSDCVAQLVDRDEMEGALRRLQPRERAILTLRFYADMTLEEAAAAIGIPIGTAKSRLSRALVALRVAFDAEARSDRALAAAVVP